MKKNSNIFLKITTISLISFLISILIIIVGVLTLEIDKVKNLMVLFLNLTILFLIVAGISIVLYILSSIIIIMSGKNVEYDYEIENSTDEFEQLFKETFKNGLEELESARKKAKNNVAICFGIIFLITIIIEFFEINNVIITLFLTFCFFFLVFKIDDNKALRNYRKIYKNNVIPEFISLVNNTMSYTPEDSELYEVYKNDYIKANFDKYKFSSFKAEDFVSGLIDDKFQVKMAELVVRREKSVMLYKETVTDFRGIFAEIDCIKDTKVDIRISQELIRNIDKANKFELDSSEFEKYFNVYTENQLQAMKLLTHEIMEILVDFYNKFQIKFEIIIRGKKLYIRFFTANLFEPKLIWSSKDKYTLYIYYTILKFVLEVTKKVNKIVNDVIIE